MAQSWDWYDPCAGQGMTSFVLRSLLMLAVLSFSAGHMPVLSDGLGVPAFSCARDFSSCQLGSKRFEVGHHSPRISELAHRGGLIPAGEIGAEMKENVLAIFHEMQAQAHTGNDNRG